MRKTSVWCGGGRGRALAAAALLTALVVTGCDLLNKEEESAEDVKVTLLAVSADGAQGGPGTTALTLTFDQSIYGLTAGDITLSEASLTKGALSGAGPAYTLAISGVSANTTINVKVEKAGYAIESSPKAVAIYAAPAVTGVTVSGPSVVAPGGTAQFSATVAGTNPPQTVTWTLSGAAAATTPSAISSSGLLTVAAAEADKTELTVLAASTANPAVSGSATITVRDSKAAAGEAATAVTSATTTASIVFALRGVPGVVVPKGFAAAVTSENLAEVKAQIAAKLNAIAGASGADAVTAALKALNAYLVELASISSIDALKAKLAALSGTSAESPATVPLAMNISDNWGDINTAVQNAGKYVVLDLSASSATGNTITGTSYSPSGNDMNVIKDNPYIRGVVLPDSVTSIGDYAFSYCTGLTSVTIPDSVTSIGEDAFYGCTGLTSVTIPDSVTSIGWGAFDGCTGLTSVTIPASVTAIDTYAFDDCTGLTSITIPVRLVPAGSYSYSSGFGEIVSDYTSLAVVLTGSGTIANYAFYNCTGLTSVTIGDSVTAISDYAFRNCSGLTSITIPDSVTNIGDYAFSVCSGLTSVRFEGSDTVIASGSTYTFPGGSSLLSAGGASASPYKMAAGAPGRGRGSGR